MFNRSTRFAFPGLLLCLGAVLMGPALANTHVSPLPANPTVNTFAGVGQFGRVTANGVTFDCTAEVICDGTYIITARHCVTTDGTITGALADPTDLRFSLGNMTFSGVAGGLTANFGADIAVLKLNQSAGAQNAFALFAGNAVGKTFAGTGFGLGSTNPGGATAEFDLPYGTNRIYFNTFDSVGAGPLAGQGTVLTSDLSDPNAANSTAVAGEGIIGDGDSGGGAFFFGSGGTFLVGIHSSSTTHPIDPNTGNETGPFFGDFERNVNISTYRNAILAACPEPSGNVLLIVGAAGILLVAARRRTGGTASARH